MIKALVAMVREVLVTRDWVYFGSCQIWFRVRHWGSIANCPGLYPLYKLDRFWVGEVEKSLLPWNSW
jgi:hypothetical protein